MKRIKVFFWDGVINESNVSTIHEFTPVTLESGKFNAYTQSVLMKILNWPTGITIKKVED